jgi:hypothetical protein
MQTGCDEKADVTVGGNDNDLIPWIWCPIELLCCIIIIIIIIIVIEFSPSFFSWNYRTIDPRGVIVLAVSLSITYVI